MIDLHCHILPGIDDGPPNFTNCVAMVERAVNERITHLFATPHHMNGWYENSKEDILQSVAFLNRYIQQEKIPLSIHPGQEIRIHLEIFDSIERDEILTLDNNGEYLLLELPSGEVPGYTQEVVYELLLRGITPIIVHPERNKGFLRDHDLLFELVQEGALTQLTSGSIIGHFGKKVKTFSEEIIKHQLAHFIATDAHNTELRSFTLNEAYESIAKKFGVDFRYYFQENAQMLITGQSPHIEQPIPIRKKIFRIF
ncbi:tyrosine-protein phosphatase [Neobacillus jeddahensis]|uniref:tyrosine-protein phosphatase n=1 Tax=Neobacillus jeddahensis TaxID=1461580 RepID=UPI00058E631C|nr:CpsB/CapC family capsule biosynthesis tyrosine phosphatase [Neobacillus jeddahensis]